MAQNGVWGTDIEIISASSLLSTDIFVHTKFGDTYKWEKFSRTMLGGQKTENNYSIYLNHTNSIHYDVVIDVFANQTDQQFLIGSCSRQTCTNQAKGQFPNERQSLGVNCNKEKQTINSSSKNPIKKCSFKSEKHFVVNENCRKKPKLENDQNHISVKGMDQQFYSGSPSDQNYNFPSSATLKNEHHSFSTIYSRKKQTVKTCSKKNLQKCNLKSDNQSTDSENCTKRPVFVKDQTNGRASHSSTVTSHQQAHIKVNCEKTKTWVDNFHFWPLNEKSQLFWCSIVKLPIFTEHTEQHLKPLGKPSKLVHILGDGNCLFRALSYVVTGQQ